MRDSAHTIPQLNRAVCTVSQNMYDRRALDCNSPIPILTTLTNLTYLTSTSPRIREVLTADGGLERILDILRGASVSPVPLPTPDLWGLSGPSTARTISIERQMALRHSLAFQCIVNIGVRGSETVRTRVVQSGSLDLISVILEEWLTAHSIVIEPCNVGSTDAAEAARGRGYAQEFRRKLRLGTRPTASDIDSERMPPGAPPVLFPPNISSQHRGDVSPATTLVMPPRHNNVPPSPGQLRPPQDPIDVDMDDNDHDAMSELASATGDASMEVDADGTVDDPADVAEQLAAAAAAAVAATPRATHGGLPAHTMSAIAIDIPPRQNVPDDVSAASSGANSYSNGGDSQALSEQSVPDIDPQPRRPPPLNLSVARIPGLAQGGPSNQSSPMGTPTRMEMGETLRPTNRRDTIVGRPVMLAPPVPRPALDGQDTAENSASELGEEPDMNVDALPVDLNTVTRQFDAFAGAEPAEPPAVEIVERVDGLEDEEPDAETMAAEQARLDLEAGAPPGQPGAMVTPTVAPPAAPAEQQAIAVTVTATGAPVVAPVTAAAAAAAAAADPNAPPPQVIIAAGAPRGFHDLTSYLALSTVSNPTAERFSDDCVLLSLQLLAYLSKYPHVRTSFHHPHRPMHPTFDFGLDEENDPLPTIPAMAQSQNVFSLVERFTFKPSVTDPMLFKIPDEIHYWAGVIMRNACRKDDSNGGIRQCAHMRCGKWEASAREFAKCRRCRKAKYCSKECQSKAWSEGHRFWCNARGEEEPTRPAPVSALPRPADSTSNEDIIAVMSDVTPAIPRDILQSAIAMSAAFHPGIHVLRHLARQNPAVRPELMPAELAAWTLRVLREQIAGREGNRLVNMFNALRAEPRHIPQMFISAALNDQVTRGFLTQAEAQGVWTETIPHLPEGAPPQVEAIQALLARSWRFIGGDAFRATVGPAIQPTNQPTVPPVVQPTAQPTVQPTTMANLEAHNANMRAIFVRQLRQGQGLEDTLNQAQIPPPTQPVHTGPHWFFGDHPQTAPPTEAVRRHPADHPDDPPQALPRPATTGPLNTNPEDPTPGGGGFGQTAAAASRFARITGLFGRGNRPAGPPDQPR